MSPRVDRSWPAVIRAAIEDALFDLHTGLPAEVVAFDAATQSCDARPLLQRAYLDDADKAVLREIPIVPRVPVVYPAGGGWAITFPLEKGDVVYLAFAERALDRWKDSEPGQAVDPVDAARHPLSGAIAIPGLRQRRDALPGLAQGNLRIGKEGSSVEIVIDTNDKVTIKASQIALGADGASKSYVLGEDLLQALNILLAFVIAHTHPVSGAATLVPNGIPIPGLATFASTLLSAKVKGQ